MSGYVAKSTITNYLNNLVIWGTKYLNCFESPDINFALIESVKLQMCEYQKYIFSFETQKCWMFNSCWENANWRKNPKQSKVLFA